MLTSRETRATISLLRPRRKAKKHSIASWDAGNRKAPGTGRNPGKNCSGQKKCTLTNKQ